LQGVQIQEKRYITILEDCFKLLDSQKQLYQHIGMILGFSMMRHSKKH